MSEEIKKTDTNSKILSFQINEEEMQDPEMDRFVRESLIREADELEEMLNSKPELEGIEAPEGLFDSIVSKLKESGVWEEDEAPEIMTGRETDDAETGKAKADADRESGTEAGTKTGGNTDADTLYARLSKEDQRALALGRELVQKQEAKARKRHRRRKVLKISGIVAACLVVVFGVSMTSDANRRLVKRMWDGLMMDLVFKVNTDYSGDKESVRSKNKEELEAMEKIQEKTGAPAIDLCYLPEGMEYQGYEITGGFESVLFYSFQDTIFSVTIVDVSKEGAYYYMYGSDAVFRETVTNEMKIEAKIWEVNPDLEDETYIAEIEHEGWRYILNGMVPLEEMRNIVKDILFL